LLAAGLGGDDALFWLDEVDSWALATSRSLRDLAAGPVGALITSAFRVMPRQPRSMETVERLLAAGEAIVKRKGRLDSLTLEAVADEAGITPQAAYRYFGDIHALILLAVRRVEAAEHERLIAFMTASAFDTEADLAKAVVAFITQAYQGMAKLPAPMRDRIARDYHDISYDVLWQVSEAIHAVMLERGDPCHRGQCRATRGRAHRRRRGREVIIFAGHRSSPPARRPADDGRHFLRRAGRRAALTGSRASGLGAKRFHRLKASAIEPPRGKTDFFNISSME
jgi:AcrR family transcriptional regulator